MNCAIHSEVPATGYCRTCGKAMCEGCKRDVKGVIYCEDCIASRLQGTLPAPAPGAAPVPVVVAAGPSPGLAAVLAAFFPFGVGAVYTSQYAKGLAHMLIFAFLVWGASTSRGGAEPVFGLGIAFFYVYQIIDAYRSAKAIQLGQPAPDPFGLARTFGTGEKLEAAKVPVGALVLIGLGVLFLLHNVGLFRFYWVGKLWPLILIALGIHLFMRRSGRC